MGSSAAWLACGLLLAGTGAAALAADAPAMTLLPDDAAAEIQVSGTGPFGLHYISPADDPGRAR